MGAHGLFSFVDGFSAATKYMLFFDYESVLSGVRGDSKKEIRRLLIVLSGRHNVCVVSDAQRQDVLSRLAILAITYAGAGGDDISGPYGRCMFESGKHGKSRAVSWVLARCSTNEAVLPLFFFGKRGGKEVSRLVREHGGASICMTQSPGGTQWADYQCKGAEELITCLEHLAAKH